MNEENIGGPLSDEHQALVDGLRQDAVSRYMGGDLGAIRHSVAMNPSDPAFRLLLDDFRSVPVVHRESCYICRDPEYAAMGMPLCSPCPGCLRSQRMCTECLGAGTRPGGELCMHCRGAGAFGSMGHIAADDVTCDECGYEHGPDDYDSEGLITGLPRERAIAIRDMRKRRSSS